MFFIQFQRRLGNIYIIAGKCHARIGKPFKTVFVAVQSCRWSQGRHDKSTVFIVQLRRDTVKNRFNLYFIIVSGILCNIKPILWQDCILVVDNLPDVVRIHKNLNRFRHSAYNNVCVKKLLHRVVNGFTHRLAVTVTVIKIGEGLLLNTVCSSKFFKIHRVHLMDFFKPYRKRGDILKIHT